MKLLYVLLCISLCGLSTAQTHRFIYEFSYKQDSTQSNMKQANMVLDINPTESKFYNHRYVVIDSTNITKGQRSMMWDSATPVVIRKKGSNTNENMILASNLFSVTSEDKINWQLTSETKEVSGYNLQKATADFGGRHWTAWFTKDIPISEGPYKFTGLPGLIFQINDDKGNFNFGLVKSYKLAETYQTPFLESFSGSKAVKVSQKILDKQLMDYYNDPMHDVRESFLKNKNPGTTYNINGVEIKDVKQFKEVAAISQKLIRDYNNPIEIDKALHYPVK